MGFEMKNTVIGSLDPLLSRPMVTKSIITIPGSFFFYDESKGAVGQREWNFQSNIFSTDKSPSLFIEDPGIYEISLLIRGPSGSENVNSITVVALEDENQQYNHGDINGDGIVTNVDVLLCANFLLNYLTFEPIEFLAADLDNNGLINIFDILLIANLTN